MGQSVKTKLQYRAGKRLFDHQVSFVRGVTHISELPCDTRPEIAVCGRSNVGKSSLINALVNRKTLARTSKTPGRTQQINYFDLAGQIYLVDLPGTGYARAPKKQIRRWSELTSHYFRLRASLVRTLVLIDIRRGIGPLDTQLLDLLNAAAIPCRIVVTKCDTITDNTGTNIESAITEKIKPYPAALIKPILTSARTGRGMDQLRRDITQCISPVA